MAHAVVRIADVYVVGVAGAADEFARDTCIHLRDAANPVPVRPPRLRHDGISASSLFSICPALTLDRFSDDVDARADPVFRLFANGHRNVRRAQVDSLM